MLCVNNKCAFPLNIPFLVKEPVDPLGSLTGPINGAKFAFKYL